MNGLKWGMTIEAIQTSLKKKLNRVPNSNVFSLKSVTAFNETFEVRLSMKNNSLSAITLNLETNPDRAIFYSLEKALIEEYGTPTYGESLLGENEILDRGWVFSITTIELNYIDLGETGLLTIRYEPTKNENKLNIENEIKNEKSYDFRKTYWGMSKSEVKQNENASIIEETDETLQYMTNLDNDKVTLVYSFVDDKLISALYFFNNSYQNPNKYIYDYERINSFLKRKYGKTSNQLDEQEWSNTLFKNDPENWGLAVSIGQLVYVNYWSKESTQIIHMLTGENYNIRHHIQYRSKKLEYLRKERKANKLDEQL